MAVPVGFTLQPEELFLGLTESIAAQADYLEVAPETLWVFDAGRRARPNGFFERTHAMGTSRGQAFVAHGVGWSPGTVADMPGRRRAWLEAIAATHEVFRFGWYTDHLGASVWDGQDLILPMAVPMTAASAARTRARLRELQSIVPDVGLENSVAHHLWGDPLDEPAFLGRVLQGPGLHLLLDLHNLHTMALNFGFEAREYLDRLPLHDVLEIHVSGGRESDPAWLPDGTTQRLDSHDDDVPDEVFVLLEEVLPRCPNLRGVTLERMEGTVGPDDVDALAADFERLRGLCG